MGRNSIRLAFLFAIVGPSLIGAAPAGAATVALSVHDFAFSPSTLTIAAGTTVTVTNTGESTHTWSSDPGDAQQWNSGDIAPGSSFSVTFTKAGRFTYHCNFHPSMTGTVLVVAATPATATPPTTVPPTTTTPGQHPPTTTSATVVPAAAPSTPPTTAVRATALPHTGARTIELFTVALLLAAIGGALVTFGARVRGRTTER